MMRETLSQTGETQEALVLHTLPFKVMGVAHILNQTICLMQMPLVFLLTMDLNLSIHLSNKAGYSTPLFMT